MLQTYKPVTQIYYCILSPVPVTAPGVSLLWYFWPAHSLTMLTVIDISYFFIFYIQSSFTVLTPSWTYMLHVWHRNKASASYYMVTSLWFRLALKCRLISVRFSTLRIVSVKNYFIMSTFLKMYWGYEQIPLPIPFTTE